MSTPLPKFDVHVCLVSAQPYPNFIPILAKEFRPQKTILIVTPQMKEKANLLENVLKNRCNIKVEQVELASEYDMMLLENQLTDLLAEYDHDKVALNLTGGTKLMAISAFNLFLDNGYSSFYFTERKNEVLLFTNGNTKQATHFKLTPSTINIEDILALHGNAMAKPIQRKLDISHPDIGHTLVQSASICDELPTLYATIATNSHTNLNIKMPYSKKPENNTELLYLFEKYGLLKTKPEQKLMSFPNYPTKQYVNGGWFEDYVFNTIKDIPGIQDIAINLQIKSTKDSVQKPNEIDIAILYNNTLHLIECKTVKYKINKNNNPDAQNEKAGDALYKLKALRDLGGSSTKVAFISFHELDCYARDRAKGDDIKLIEKKDLKGLRTLIANWLNNRTSSHN